MTNTLQSISTEAFFRDRENLGVSPNFASNFEFKTPIDNISLPTGQVLKAYISEYSQFGGNSSCEGADRLSKTFDSAVELYQIQRMMEIQWNGTKGLLLINGSANIFPVISKKLSGHRQVLLVRVYRFSHIGDWYVDCAAIYDVNTLSPGCKIFFNCL